jgi:molybdopterin-containing oxidoreductase family membrane subunit
MLTGYIVAKIIDTLWWALVTAPSKGFSFVDFYTSTSGSAYGLWIFIAEIGVCGVLPALILITQKGRKSQIGLFVAVLLAVIGVCLNRWVMVLQVLAIPVLPFEHWNLYFPSWQEIATTVMTVAYGIIMVSVSYRYLPVFPQEQELNPIDPPASQVDETTPETEGEDESEAPPATAELEPSPAGS